MNNQLERTNQALGLELEALKAENARLRAILPKVLDALGNGSGCMADCSVEFLEWIPGEVAGVVRECRRQLREAYAAAWVVPVLRKPGDSWTK